MRLIIGDCLIKMKELEDNSVDSIVTDPPYGLSFMGKKWDYDVPSVEIWKECLRVLKPGGYLLSFAGTRTQHRMCVNIEDAGFEIRDMIAWVYGSGFPKSHNIGKAVDKLQGNEREITGQDQSGSKRNCMAGDFEGGKYDLTKGNSPYEGWGTALKPALEPITVARKPFNGTVANNVLKWGTGGINIDGCRVGSEILKEHKSGNIPNDRGKWGLKEGYKMPERQGRFPANLIHDGSDEVVGLFPDTKSGGRKGIAKRTHGVTKFGSESVVENPRSADSGSAARFFYCAKASKSERNAGCEGLEEKATASSEFRPNHTEKAKKGEDGNPYGRWTPTKNNHPTVKPTKLMQYLVRLVTPKDGTVLDPFMGSGSTGIACKKEGFNFIGIELDEEYVKIAEARINAVANKLI